MKLDKEFLKLATDWEQDMNYTPELVPRFPYVWRSSATNLIVWWTAIEQANFGCPKIGWTISAKDADNKSIVQGETAAYCVTNYISFLLTGSKDE